MFAEIKQLQQNTHYANISSHLPDDTTWSIKHKQKPTKQSAEALWKKKKSFSEELLCSPYSH